MSKLFVYVCVFGGGGYVLSLCPFIKVLYSSCGRADIIASDVGSTSDFLIKG